jgi:hypothetical protein
MAMIVTTVALSVKVSMRLREIWAVFITFALAVGVRAMFMFTGFWPLVIHSVFPQDKLMSDKPIKITIKTQNKLYG